MAFDEEKRAEKRAVTELFDSNYLKDPVKESKCPQCAACRCDNSFRFHLVESWKLVPWSFRHPLLRPRPAQQLALSSLRMGRRGQDEHDLHEQPDVPAMRGACDLRRPAPAQPAGHAHDA